MKWIYHIPNGNTWDKNGITGIQNILLRPLWEEDGNIYTSGVVDFRIMALDFITQVQSKEKLEKEEHDFLNEIRAQLVDKIYHIHDPEPEDDDKKHYLSRPHMYVIHQFNLDDLFKWIRIYLDFKGYPCDSFEEAGFENFAFDVNPVLRIFSIDNAKKFEMQLGPEWWRSKKERD